MKPLKKGEISRPMRVTTAVRRSNLNEFSVQDHGWNQAKTPSNFYPSKSLFMKTQGNFSKLLMDELKRKSKP